MGEVVTIPNKTEFKCTIETPQFLGSYKKYYMHRQCGIYNQFRGIFTPFEFNNGNHCVWAGLEGLKNSLISIDE